MDTTTFRIDGMHCDGCADRIRTLLGKEPGVREARVSFAEGSAAVRFNPHTVSEARFGHAAISSFSADLIVRSCAIFCSTSSSLAEACARTSAQSVSGSARKDSNSSISRSEKPSSWACRMKRIRSMASFE